LTLSGLFTVIACFTFPSGAAPPVVAYPDPVPAWSGVLPSRSGLAETLYAQGGPEAWSGSYETGIRAQSEQNPLPPSAPATPSQPQTPPAPQPAQSQPTESGQGQLAPAASEAAKLEPAEVQDLLQKIYVAAFRFTDLLTVLQPDKWKMDDAARQSFNQVLESVRGQLKTLDEDRKQFLQKLENSDLADKTDAAIAALLPNIDAVAAAVSQYDGPAQGTQYKQPADQLRELQKSLQPYVLYLRAKAGGLATPPQAQTAAAPAGQVPAQTQQGRTASASQGQPAPAANQGAKLEPEQLRDLLQRIYVVTFRFTDLVGILQPDKWKMDDTARQSFNHALEAVRGQLKTLDEDRKQLLEKLENSDLADKTDASITALLPNMEAVAAAVTQYDSPAQGTQYKLPADQLRELQKSLQPYVLYLRAQAGATPTQLQAPPAPSAQPPAQTQQRQPASASQGQPAPAANQGTKLEPAQLKDLLQRIYVVTFRFTDLVGILQPDKWKMEGTARQLFNQALETVRGQLKTLDENRKLFLERSENLDLAGKTDASITALLPNIEAVAAAVTQYDGPAQGTQYKQPADQLRELQKLLQPYVFYLRAKVEAGLAPIPGVETEVIQPSTTPMAMVPTDVSGPPPPMGPEQLKQVLYKMYVLTYRIQDVLSHEQSESLKAPEAERASFRQARATLQAKLAEFEKVRNQFAASPASPDLAFQTYVSALSVQDPLEQVSKSLSTQGEAKLADEFRQRGRELIAAQQELVPYISYFVSRWDRAAQMFQSNLAACEKQLNYAMHFHTQAATPLPNINPEFQGHGHKTTSSKETATKAATTKAVKTTPSKKTAKQSSKQASAKASQAKSQTP